MENQYRFRAVSNSEIVLYYLLHGGYLASVQVKLLEHRRNVPEVQVMLPHVTF